jgi:uncharacterized membrane protein YeaQ/YmgE (transglycosylase-associated protein family)
MSGESLLVTLIVGGIAGWLAGLVTRGSGFGIIGDVIVGLIGAFIGNYIVNAFHLVINFGHPWLNLGVIAFIGGVVLLVIVGLLVPPSFGRRWR